MSLTGSLFRLDGKVALVTGGAGTVGSIIARALGEVGAHVIVASRDAGKCREFASQLCNSGVRAEGERCDVGSEEEITALRDRILERHSRLDVLFNNSLARAGGELDETSAAEWEASMQVNATGLFLACKIFGETMRRRRSGSS